MLKKRIRYEDYDGIKREEDFWFHLNKAEVSEWLMQSGGYTLDKVMLKLARENNVKDLMGVVKDLISRSYGEKSVDGKRFIKSKEQTEAFLQTEAYSNLFMELMGDGEEMAKFFTGIIPKDLADDIDKAIKDNPEGIPDELKDYLPNKK